MPARLAVIVVIAVLAVVSAAYVYTLAQPPAQVTTSVPSSFTVNGRTYRFTSVATTQAEWTTGLMNTKITNATTMLFAFPYFSRWTFWMLDTNTSLDMIWLNGTGSSARVVYLVVGAPPCYKSSTCLNYVPSSQANYVIEAKAGFAAANGIEVGSAIELS